MSERKRPYISFTSTDRPASEEHYDAAQLLVQAVLKKFTGDLLRQAEKYAGVVIPLAAEQVMEQAYFTSCFGQLRLMGKAEVVAHLGLKCGQQVASLQRGKTVGFPKPVAELRMGPVWLAEQIEEFGRTWERKRTGRPRKAKEDSA